MNLSNGTSPGNLKDDKCSDWSREPKMIAALIIGAVGIYGNLLIILIAVKYTVRRNLHHLIINLSITNTILIILTEIELQRRMYVDGNDELSSKAKLMTCSFMVFLRDGFFLLKIMTLLGISVERFRVIRTDLYIIRPYSINKQLAMVAVFWLLALGFCGFNFHTTKVERIGESFECTFDIEEAIPWYMGYLVVFFIIHSSIDILSFLTLRRLTKGIKFDFNLSEELKKLRAARTKRVVKMVISSAIVLAICYFPVSIMGLWALADIKRFKFMEDIGFTKCSALNYIWEFFLPIVNYALDPFFCLYFLNDFGKVANKLNSRIASFCRRKSGNYVL